MPFDEVEIITRENEPPTALVTYMRPARKAAKGENYDRTGVRPRLYITIPTTICGAAKSKKFKLMLGSGADKGKARIMGDDGAKIGVKPHEFKYAFRFNFGYVPKFGDDIFDDERVPVRRISAEVFEFDLPTCLKG